MKSSRIILALMLVAIMVSVICVSVSAGPYLDTLGVHSATVTLDGVNDATATVAIVVSDPMTVYGVNGTWTLTDKEASGKISLTALGSDALTFSGMNYVDVPTGVVMWTDDNFVGVNLALGTKVLTATYTVAKDTPAGRYTVEYTSALLTADDYENDQTAKVFTCYITVVGHEHQSNAQYPCQDGTCSCGQAMPGDDSHEYNYDCDKNCKFCGEETRPTADHAYNYDCDKNCKFCGVETRPDATHQYFYPCDPVCTICFEMTNPDAAHDLTHHEAKKGTDCQTYDGNIEYWSCEHCNGCWDNENATGAPLNAMSVKAAGDHTYTYDCDKVCSVCEVETRPEAEHEYTYECDMMCKHCFEFTNPNATHDLTHHEAKKGTDCQTWDGNVEYWECEHCGGCWDNENAMYAPITGRTKANGDHVYTADCDTICDLCDEETRQSDVEHEYTYECDKFCKNCYDETNPDAEHKITHHEAKKGTDCQTWDGNVEYWSCDYCGICWDNENGTGMPLNAQTVKDNGDHDLTHVEAKPATEEADGNIEYWYCEICGCYFADEDCTEEITEDDTFVPYVPPTADTATLIPAVVLGMLAVTGAAILVSKKDLLK